MLTFDDAVSVVRSERPDYLVWHGFDFRGYYWFTISPGKVYIKDDLAAAVVMVNKETGSFRPIAMGDIADMAINEWSEDEIKQFNNCEHIPVDVNVENE